MARRCGDLRDDHFVDLRAARFDIFRLNAGTGKQFRDLFRVLWKIDKFAQPVNGKFHDMSFREQKSGVEEWSEWDERHGRQSREVAASELGRQTNQSLTIICETEMVRDVSTLLDITKKFHANCLRKRRSFCANK